MMRAKRINITIPEENLREINEFCVNEKVNKSWLIREATSQYIADIREQKEIERKKKDMEWAAKMMEKLRKKKITFKDGKTAEEVIREFRDSR
jgi:metal-responsive CopG/Arc/MetJ family transcriptional regulator